MQTMLSSDDGLYRRIRDGARQFPAKLAVACGTKQFSYQELHSAVVRVSTNLEHFFTKDTQKKEVPDKRRRIATLYKNSFELVVLAIAIAKLGWTLIPLNTALRGKQITRQLQCTTADALVTGEAGLTVIEKLPLEIDAISMEALFDRENPVDVDNPGLLRRAKDLDHDYIITLSSGSTGQPKPIVLSQASKIRRAEQARQSYDISAEDVVLCASPFYHSLGQRLVFLPLVHHGTLVLLEHFSTKAWLQAVSSYQVTFTIAVSSHLHALQETLLKKSTSLESLRCLVSSSSHLSYQLKSKLMQNLNCDFHEMYGATEVATVTNLKPDSTEEKMGSVGLPLPGLELLILDQSGRRAPTGETGEIACNTPCVFSRYDNLPDITEKSFANGYFLTGDLGYLDAEGYLYFVSRKKDIIITGGINVVPSDIEAELNAHVAVKESCVIGVNDEYLGEAVFAVCALVDDVTGDANLEQKLRLFLNEKLAGYQNPKAYGFVDAIPLTGSGKPDKQALREKYKDYTTQVVANV